MKLISDTTFGLECKAKEKEFTRRIDYLDWYERVRNNFWDIWNDQSGLFGKNTFALSRNF